MITTWSEGIADANMDEAILVELAHIVRAHPWWRARARLTLTLLHRLGVRSPARVLDAGCGWGTTLEALDAAATGLRVWTSRGGPLSGSTVPGANCTSPT